MDVSPTSPNEIQPIDQHIREIRVRSLAFSIKGDLEAVGNAVLQKILDLVTKNSKA